MNGTPGVLPEFDRAHWDIALISPRLAESLIVSGLWQLRIDVFSDYRVMKRYLLCSIASAVVGATLAWSWQDVTTESIAGAQEPRGKFVSSEVERLRPGPPSPFGIPDELTPEERVNIAVYENVNRSVVNINTKVRTEAFFILEVPSEGMGSGSILDKSGHIVTNYHVIEGAKEIEVSLFNGQSYPGKLVGADPSSDLAVLSIEAPAESLFPVTIGDSSNLKVGQKIYAIGNPFGQERSLTTGIISSLNRSLPIRNHVRLRSIIQIDADINPGNSGGPLLDTRGRLIGMNTAIASRTGQSTGVGFAIPASTISLFVPQLIEKGRVIRPETGITRVYETEQGLLVAGLMPGGPAEAAGMRGPQIKRDRRKQGPFVYESTQIDRTAADLIVAVDNVPITTADQFLAAVESKPPGAQVTITVKRQGQDVAMHVRLAEAQ